MPKSKAAAQRSLTVGDVHHVDLPMRWGDSDPLNHMNNTIYFRLMEEARMQMLLAAGVDLDPRGQGPVLAHAACDFLKQLQYPVLVRVVHRVLRIGRSSMEFDVAMEKMAGNAPEPGPCATGRGVLVWMDYRAGKSAPWPEDVLTRLGGQFTPGY